MVNVVSIQRPIKQQYAILVNYAPELSFSSLSLSPFRNYRATRLHPSYFSTGAKQGHKPKYQHNRSFFVVAAAVAVTASLYTRHLREEKLTTLPLAKDSELLREQKLSVAASSTASSSQEQPILSHSQPMYNLPSLIETVTRAGLMGSTKSVKEELHVLRKWHANRGYNGGIVVRDLSRPLFSLNIGHETNDEGKGFHSVDENVRGNMSQRECYYLYYEVHSNGETRQQLFCRGTTLFDDVITCLQAWCVHDEELGCSVHFGFNQHANRVVEDVLPLLVPPRGKEGGTNHATVEVCGHSLGGAVAMLVAIKLRKRGYFVTRVTSLASPRFCSGVEESNILKKWLPKETIRIEDDLDPVIYLPPMGVSVGDKLWFVKDKAYMLPKDSLSGENGWPESVWLNLRLFETVLNVFKTHRVGSYVNRLEQLVKDMNGD
mmetsp:Transcript_6359/g.12111  ORF Transcript_6359/g.12111 Transcript_6359/m.12111 type:complete len:433 (-) Transcript_6359:52-1350(-)